MCVGLVFGCRRPELGPPAVAGTTHVERRSDGSVSGRHGALYAQFQLRYGHGVSNGSVWAFHCYGEFQLFTKPRTDGAKNFILKTFIPAFLKYARMPISLSFKCID